jgi:diaminopimelate epimerase
VEIEFAKGEATGNDFVLVYDPDATLNLSIEQIRLLCNRNFGIGADGLILIRKTANSSEVADQLAEEPRATWFMDYRNADGSSAEMCGNGIRLYAHFLLERGLAQLESGSTLPIATRAGIKDISRVATGYAVDLGEWRLEEAETLVRTPGLGAARPAISVWLGNPHQVVVVPDLQQLGAINLATAPTVEPPSERGENVEFVVPADPLVVEGVGQLSMRVHERGVGETLSCGTGAAAAALAVRHLAGGSQNHWRVEVPGGTLGVMVFQAEAAPHVALSGPARISFTGQIDV